jgi:hypothetical protein
MSVAKSSHCPPEKQKQIAGIVPNVGTREKRGIRQGDHKKIIDTSTVSVGERGI